MGYGRELDWDEEPDSGIMRTAASASPFQDAWDDGEGGLDFDDVGETEVVASPVETSVERSLPIGTLVANRYVIEGKLGEGAMGVVYDASHMSTRKRVALKYLDPHAATAPQALKRFFRESQIAALVKHPNVVEVFDGGRFGNSYFLAMERLEGQTLAEAIEHERLDLAQVVDVFIGICDGVGAVHETGVIHRDMKPDNVFLTSGPGLGHPKVLDFGVSKLKQPDPASPKLTMTGQMMGTPHYMGPEQFADSASADARSDVYSIGVMLYEAVAGAVPYEGDNVLAIYRMASDGKPKPLAERRPETPTSLVEIVEKAMQPDPAARFATVLEMRSALAEVAIAGRSGRWVPADPRAVRENQNTLPAPPPAGGAPARPKPMAQTALTGPGSPSAPEATEEGGGMGVVIALGVGVGLGLAVAVAVLAYFVLA